MIVFGPECWPHGHQGTACEGLQVSQDCEEQVPLQHNPLMDCSVIIEDEMVVFLPKGCEESEDMPTVLLTLLSSIGKCVGDGSHCLVPGDERKFDSFGSGGLSS